MTRKDLMQAAMEKDDREMRCICDAVAAGLNPDAAASLVVGGEFHLSDYVLKVLEERSYAC